VTQRNMRDLLTRACESFDSIQLEWDVASNGPVLARAMQRSIPDFEQRVAEGSIAMFEARRETPRGSGQEDDPWSRHSWRAWWRKPSHWRDDYQLGDEWGDRGGNVVQLAVGASSSVYVPMLRTLYTNQRPDGLVARLKHAVGPRNYFRLPTVTNRLRETCLVDPSFLADGWELSILGDRTHAGRSAVRARAQRLSAASEEGGERLGYWDYIKDYEILVDRERGILLRYAGIVDGEEAGVLSVRSVRFDEPIPDEIFAYEPPEGTRVAWVEGSPVGQ
jgi:hypothetical protein